MNIDRVIRRIKRSIGLYGIALPVKDLDRLILDILEDTTLPVFSIYQPHIEIVPVDLSVMTVLDRSRGEASNLFIIPEQLLIGRELLYVMEVKYDEHLLAYNYAPSSYAHIPESDLIESLLLANAQKPVYDGMVTAITFHYEHPRKLYIYNSLCSGLLKIKMGFTHDTSFQSIPPTAEESFFKLAILDIKDGLYNTVKHYTDIDTPFGRIELKIEDWTSAKGEREELLKEWDESYLLDQVGYEYG